MAATGEQHKNEKKYINNNNDRRIRIRDKKNTTINTNDKTQIIGAITLIDRASLPFVSS